MKITSVRTHLLRYRLPRAIGPSTAMYSARESLLVKVSTDEGPAGWGETAPLGGFGS